MARRLAELGFEYALTRSSRAAPSSESRFRLQWLTVCAPIVTSGCAGDGADLVPVHQRLAARAHPGSTPLDLRQFVQHRALVLLAHLQRQIVVQPRIGGFLAGVEQSIVTGPSGVSRISLPRA